MDLCSTSISTQACPCPRSCEEQPSSLKKRCLAAAKEQRSRFYILKRCIIMLLCWQKICCWLQFNDQVGNFIAPPDSVSRVL
ncbi:hypothetical protein L6164_032227 [Bauhinia variegata]|uniref:Uncharacterized protein n=1 Tax=Bauhinia variegata TaxID=167791 RepID=A0ACB9KN13_BAUVA|nr:hypothetical protein L6164_032227 [Bauhinia variegata]